MKLKLVIVGFSLYVAAINAFSADDQAAPQLRISSGKISQGMVDAATIDTEPPVGAKYKKGDILEGGVISDCEKVSGILDKTPDSYNTKSGAVYSISNAVLSNSKITKAVIFGAIIQNRGVIDEKITVNLTNARINKASIKGDAEDKPLDISLNDILAASKQANTKPPTMSTPAKDITFEGDYIYIKNEVRNFTEVNGNSNAVTAKPGTKFHVAREQKLDDGKHKLILTRSDCGGMGDTIADIAGINCKKIDETDKDDPIKKGLMYSINKEEILYGNYLHRGIGWGVMVSPFKFYPKGKTLAPGNSIGPYLSYMYDKPGVSWGPAMSFSYTSLPVTTIQNGISNTTNQSGLTFALGLLFRVKDQFTIGVMAGRDYIDSQYKYNGATWFGANFGYELGN